MTREVKIDEPLLWDSVRRMAALGPRLAGYEGLTRFEDWLFASFTEAGLAVERHPFTARPWRVTASRLALDPGGEVDIAAVYPESGTTEAAGVNAPPCHLGDLADAVVAADLAGRIAVVDYPLPAVEMRHAHVWAAIAEASGEPPLRARSAGAGWMALEKLRRELAAAGAAGLVVVVERAGDALGGSDYHPIFSPSARKLFVAGGSGDAPGAAPDLPAVWIHADDRERVLRATRASLRVLTAPRNPVPVHSIVATLPGHSDDAIALVSHVDGINAVQENGPTALVAIARALAGQTRTERRHTLVFACVAAHLNRDIFAADGVTAAEAEAEGLFARMPALRGAVRAAISVEHLGASEWRGIAGAAAPTGRNVPAHCIASAPALAEAACASIDAACAPVTIAEGRVWGMAWPFAELGIPALSYGCVPSYMMSIASDGHIGRVSRTRLAAEANAILRLLRRLDGSP